MQLDRVLILGGYAMCLHLGDPERDLDERLDVFLLGVRAHNSWLASSSEFDKVLLQHSQV